MRQEAAFFLYSGCIFVVWFNASTFISKDLNCAGYIFYLTYVLLGFILPAVAVQCSQFFLHVHRFDVCRSLEGKPSQEMNKKMWYGMILPPPNAVTLNTTF